MRSFESYDLVQLPRLSAEETLTLIYELETEAEGVEGLSEPVHEALAEVAVSREELSEALVRKRRLAAAEGGGVDPVRARAADRSLDNCWGALHDLLFTWGRLEGDPRAGRARRLRAAIFPDGLGFLNKPFKAQWADSETRLALLAREGYDVEIEGFGGAPFLKAVREAHHEYGEALHVKARHPGPSESVDLREAVAEAHGAVREYALQVAASRRRSKPETGELADRLLGPLARWVSRERASKKPADAPTPAPVDPSEGD
ncbi:MAG TPA: hypothetical protein VFS43_09385 [Polyangiaceae bacterium]|nr:hypothetical protein [Polyangiaceae bacterium]